jgi:hypothetical protein
MMTASNPKILIALRLDRGSLTGNGDARPYADASRYKSSQSIRSPCRNRLQQHQNWLLGIETDAKYYLQTPELDTASPYVRLKSP